VLLAGGVRFGGLVEALIEALVEIVLELGVEIFDAGDASTWKISL